MDKFQQQLMIKTGDQQGVEGIYSTNSNPSVNIILNGETLMLSKTRMFALIASVYHCTSNFSQVN
jgi:hypothetical protein